MGAAISTINRAQIISVDLVISLNGGVSFVHLYLCNRDRYALETDKISTNNEQEASYSTRTSLKMYLFRLQKSRVKLPALRI